MCCTTTYKAYTINTYSLRINSNLYYIYTDSKVELAWRYMSKLKIHNLENMEHCFNLAKKLCIKWVQGKEFSRELVQLQSGSHVIIYSTISVLYPLIDDDGIIQVGGWLKNAEVTYSQKHLYNIWLFLGALLSVTNCTKYVYVMPRRGNNYVTNYFNFWFPSKSSK